VDVLLHFSASVNEEDSYGETALHFAAGLASSSWNLFGPVADYTGRPTASFCPFPPEPNPEVVAHLLAAGADANAVDFEGATPLMYAAEGGTPEVLRALLAAGTDPDAQDA
jgi:ankyrin repeat protein